KKFGIKGAVKDVQRAYYADWAEARAMPRDVIDHAASLAVGKANPFAYMNKIIIGWHDAGLTDLQKAKASAPPQAATDAQNGTVSEKYSADELNALFTQITEDDK
ncbi:MAG: DnaD domain protein, partial [Clostridia bacterium]|nr:DnaD domain protein [Clostridia bacterium]